MTAISKFPRGNWIIATATNKVMSSTGSLAKLQDLIMHEMTICHRQSPKELVEELVNKMTKDWQKCNSLRRTKLYLIFIPHPWPYKIEIKYLENKVKILQVRNENTLAMFDIKDPDCKKTEREWKLHYVF